MTGYSVHDEPDFARVYEEDDTLSIRRGDLRALLDLATGSMNFSSGFWDQEQCEIARKAAETLGIDPDDVTPGNMICQYRGSHDWVPPDPQYANPMWWCADCGKRSASDPNGAGE